MGIFPFPNQTWRGGVDIDRLRPVYERTAVGASPLAIEEARKHLRLDTQADDAIVDLLILAALDIVEGFTGRELRENTWLVRLDCFASRIPIDLHPVKQIDSITHVVAAAPVTIASTVYYLKHLPQSAEIVLGVDQEWPDDTDEIEQAIEITLTTAASKEHAAAGKLGALHVLTHLYENRGDVDLPVSDLVRLCGAKRILDPITVVRV